MKDIQAPFLNRRPVLKQDPRHHKAVVWARILQPLRHIPNNLQLVRAWDSQVIAISEVQDVDR